jgi:hypothetical protein
VDWVSSALRAGSSATVTAGSLPAGAATTTARLVFAASVCGQHNAPHHRSPGRLTVPCVSAQQHAPGCDAHPHDLPAHARRPSTTAQAAIPSATTPSSHQTPTSVLAASPANTAMARQAHSRFCVPSPAVAADPSRVPIRRLAIPSAGSKTAVPAVRTSPAMLVPARSPVTRPRVASTAMWGEEEEADRHELLGTSLRGSAGQAGPGEPPDYDDTAMASTPLSRPKPSRATDPASTAATIATPPSTPIQASVSHDSIRAIRGPAAASLPILPLARADARGGRTATS